MHKHVRFSLLALRYEPIVLSQPRHHSRLRPFSPNSLLLPPGSIFLTVVPVSLNVMGSGPKLPFSRGYDSALLFVAKKYRLIVEEASGWHLAMPCADPSSNFLSELNRVAQTAPVRVVLSKLSFGKLDHD